jgi:poly-gamma-glutamate synthesis protein (capsule biosynthesis protein)
MRQARLLLAGDVMTGRAIDQVLPQPCAPVLYESWVRDARDYIRLAERVSGPVPAPVDLCYIWGDALAEMDRLQPDLRIVNLETAVTSRAEPWPGKRIHYRMHPANVGCLTEARLDACTLANNHVLDWGRAGLLDTLETLEGAGLRTAGAGRDRDEAWQPAALPLPAGGRALLFGLATTSSGVPREWVADAGRSGVAWVDEISADTARDVAAAVEQARGPNDVVVVSVHWGGNWGFAIPGAHRDFAHALIDLGAADVVHGHSSHHPLPIEVYRGRPILYGCGDLVNDYEGIAPVHKLRSDIGCLYLVALDAQGELQRLEIVALQLRRFRLGQCDAAALAWLQDAWDTHGRRFGSQLAPQPGGRFALRWDG